MDTDPRITLQTLKVLAAFGSSPRIELSGAEIRRLTKVASGSLYPILLRLERAGWLASRWEIGDPRELGRPRRRLYQITGLGERRAREAFAQTASTLGGLSWS
jgi:PadR family transcriptional regulator PadR